MRFSNSIINEIWLLAQQSISLSKTLVSQPSLENLCFQGKPLGFYSSLSGFLVLCCSRMLGNFDKVANNHGIKRVRRLGYNDALIWSANHAIKNISFQDRIIGKLEENFPVISKEVLRVINKRQKFPDSDELTNKTGLWSWLSFFNSDGSDNTLLQKFCPKTTAIIKSLGPNLKFGFCFISILEPNTTIAPHKGSSSLRYRYHLCIDADTSDECGIRVGNQWIKWTVGRAFGFNDALDHEVVYTGNKPRIVLIIDLWPQSFDCELIQAISIYPNILELGTLGTNQSGLAVND